jgi:molecular chaperone GrpE
VGEGTHPVIGNVMRRGYRVGEQVVRHAMVGVVDTVPEDDGTAAPTESADGAVTQDAESDS